MRKDFGSKLDEMEMYFRAKAKASGCKDYKEACKLEAKKFCDLIPDEDLRNKTFEYFNNIFSL